MGDVIPICEKKHERAASRLAQLNRIVNSIAYGGMPEERYGPAEKREKEHLEDIELSCRIKTVSFYLSQNGVRYWKVDDNKGHLYAHHGGFRIQLDHERDGTIFALYKRGSKESFHNHVHWPITEHPDRRHPSAYRAAIFEGRLRHTVANAVAFAEMPDFIVKQLLDQTGFIYGHNHLYICGARTSVKDKIRLPGKIVAVR